MAATEMALKLYWAVVGGTALALAVAGSLALRASDAKVRRVLMAGAFAVIPGLVWASLTLGAIYRLGSFEPIPPASGLLLLVTGCGGVCLFLVVEEGWRALRAQAWSLSATVLCGLAWASTMCMELICISTI